MLVNRAVRLLDQFVAGPIAARLSRLYCISICVYVCEACGTLMSKIQWCPNRVILGAFSPGLRSSKIDPGFNISIHFAASFESFRRSLASEDFATLQI